MSKFDIVDGPKENTKNEYETKVSLFPIWMWNSSICCAWEEKKTISLFDQFLFMFALVSLITQTSPTGPLTDIHFRTSIAMTDRYKNAKYVFKLPALRQHQYIDSQ